MRKAVVYARVVPYICMVLIVAGVVFYVGYAIDRNNRALCKLTVRIEEVGTNGPLVEDVRELNKEYHCKRLVR